MRVSGAQRLKARSKTIVYGAPEGAPLYKRDREFRGPGIPRAKHKVPLGCAQGRHSASLGMTEFLFMHAWGLRMTKLLFTHA
jgi:hypothetical protein